MQTYPHSPGWKKPGTSSDAAKRVRKPHNLKARILSCLRERGPRTADEAAFLIGENILTVRPRFSELGREGRIETTGERRPNESGRSADVWRFVK